MIYKEKWRYVPGFEGVLVSSQGRVRRDDQTLHYAANKRQQAYKRIKKGGLVKPWFHNVDKRPFVSVQKDIGVHRLVCLAFHGLPPRGKPEACHKDGNINHNEESNLYWGSHKENMQDMVRHGTSCRGERNPQHKISKDKAFEIWTRRHKGERGVDLAAEFGISSQTVCDIMKKRIWPEIHERK